MRLFRKRDKGPQKPEDAAPADPNERSPQLGLKFKDLSVMGALVEAGADLAQARQITHYLYAHSAEVARTLADAAEARGFDVQIREPLPEYPGQWRLTCEMETAVLPDFVRETTDFFEALAAEHHAEYDGWEASAI